LTVKGFSRTTELAAELYEKQKECFKEKFVNIFKKLKPFSVKVSGSVLRFSTTTFLSAGSVFFAAFLSVVNITQAKEQRGVVRERESGGISKKQSFNRDHEKKENIREVFVSIKKTEVLGPEVKRLRDGTVRFFFPGFSADIKRNGDVSFGRKRSTGQIEQSSQRAGENYQKRMKDAFAPDDIGGEIKWAPNSGFSTGTSGDVTDVIMRSKGQDPYAAAKLRFLETTKEWRSDIRRKAHRRNIARYLRKLPFYLKNLWDDSSLGTAHKKRILFELWDECIESPLSNPTRRTPGKTNDDEQLKKEDKEDTNHTWRNMESAQKARGIIIRFIRKHLPATDDNVYTAEELKRYNRQRSGKQLFSPYL